MPPSVASVLGELAVTGQQQALAFIGAEVAFTPAYAAVANVVAEVAGTFPPPPPSVAIRSLVGIAPGNAIGGW